MSETKIQLPEGMLKAALEGLGIEVVHARRKYVKAALEAALRWLDGVLEDLLRKVTDNSAGLARRTAIEDVRRMFLAPEPETSLPEEWIRACARNVPKGAVTMKIYSAQGILLETVDLEAYRRGQQSK